ncbi:MAG: hypothetical protein OEX80_06425 [Candidatus Aminicenantes bacterium]|nr:hypothetical protein [Candidatus Aminicenantes bacterium]
MVKQRILRLLSTKFILALISLGLLSYFTVTLGWEASSWLTGMSIILGAYFGVNQYQKKLLVK